MADNARNAADEPSRAIDEKAVDHLDVSRLPKLAAQEACTTGKESVIKTIKAVFVIEDVINDDETCLDGFWNIRTLHVEEPGKTDTSRSEQEWQGSQGM